MPKYRVSLTTVLSYTVEVEAEDKEKAIEAAYDTAPNEVYGATYEEGKCLDVNDAWQLQEPEAEEITEA